MRKLLLRRGAASAVRIPQIRPERELELRVHLLFTKPNPERYCWGFSSLSTHMRVGLAAEIYFLNRPANPRSGRSALVSRPGGAATTEAIALSAGMPVTVIPMEANDSGLDRSTPGFGKIMCLL